MADNKAYLTQFISDFQTRNAAKLQEMKTNNPDLLVAVQDILIYLGDRYGLTEKVELINEQEIEQLQALQSVQPGATGKIPVKKIDIALYPKNGARKVYRTSSWKDAQDFLSANIPDLRSHDNFDVIYLDITWENLYKCMLATEEPQLLDTIFLSLPDFVINNFTQNTATNNDSNVQMTDLSFEDQQTTPTAQPQQATTTKSPIAKFSWVFEDKRFNERKKGDSWAGLNDSIESNTTLKSKNDKYFNFLELI